MKYQLDCNYGRWGGWLFSVIGETQPGYWELISSVWFPWYPTSVLEAGL